MLAFCLFSKPLQTLSRKCSSTSTCNDDIPLNNIPVLPSEFVAQPAQRTVLPSRLQPQHSKCLWNYHALLVVVWRWYTFEGLETLHGSRATGSLMWNHAADGAPEHLRRSAVVPWATSFGVVTGLLAEEGLVLYCLLGWMLVGADPEERNTVWVREDWTYVWL